MTPEGAALKAITRIKFAPLYGITKDGQVWSQIKPGRCRGVADHWHQLKGSKAGKGYSSVLLSYDGIHKSYYLHRLVWEAFMGEIKPGMEVNHINGIKSDNRLENLEVVTSSENKRHAFRTGLSHPLKGSEKPCAKLNEQTVCELRRRASAGESVNSLAKVFGISHQTAQLAVHRRTWKHVSQEQAS